MARRPSADPAISRVQSKANALPVECVGGRRRVVQDLGSDASQLLAEGVGLGLAQVERLDRSVLEVADLGCRHAELVDIRREPSGKVLATLTYDEAVVLFELLGRWESRAVLDDKELWSDRAERQVLWELHAELEPVIDEAFLPSYSEVVRAAWAAVRGPENP